MTFISLTFAAFFVIFVSLYHLVVRLQKNAVLAQQILLLSASLVFYAAADVRFVPFLLYIVAVSYFGGRFAKSRFSFALFLIADLAPLLFFKYAPSDWHTHIVFPLGLSFFTFQSVSYIADCRTGKIESEKNPLFAALFVSFFPVISSGPIQRAENLIPQFKATHRFDYDNATDGLKLFAWGMFKKLCVADRIAMYVNYVYAPAALSDRTGLSLILATALYSFQIYADFSAYSDMAIGIARYLGFDAGKNFDHPYLSQSVGEFWRRWHISLSSWLRDYIYIPLGGSRVALPRIYLNLVITFLASGIWHGAGWNFVAWGVLHGLYQCVGRAAKPVLEKAWIPAWVKIAVTFCLVSFAWIFFRAGNLHDAGIIIGKIARLPSDVAAFFTMKGNFGAKEAVRTMFALNNDTDGGFAGMAKLLALIILFLSISIGTRKMTGLEIIRMQPIVLRYILYIALCSMILPAAITNTNTEFLYFAF